jgi:hypothetical protein
MDRGTEIQMDSEVLGPMTIEIIELPTVLAALSKKGPFAKADVGFQRDLAFFTDNTL